MLCFPNLDGVQFYPIPIPPLTSLPPRILEDAFLVGEDMILVQIREREGLVQGSRRHDDERPTAVHGAITCPNERKK